MSGSLLCAGYTARQHFPALCVWRSWCDWGLHTRLWVVIKPFRWTSILSVFHLSGWKPTTGRRKRDGRSPLTVDSWIPESPLGEERFNMWVCQTRITHLGLAISDKPGCAKALRLGCLLLCHRVLFTWIAVTYQLHWYLLSPDCRILKSPEQNGTLKWFLKENIVD